jgi:hypothetical protein
VTSNVTSSHGGAAATLQKITDNNPKNIHETMIDKSGGSQGLFIYALQVFCRKRGADGKRRYSKMRYTSCI